MMLDDQQLAALTARFYQRAVADPIIGPVIAAALPAGRMEEHQVIFRDFWSQFLLGTDRYTGNAFAAHAGLALQPAHFTRWLEIFAEVAAECLPPDTAARALAQARHMSECLQGRSSRDDQQVAWPLGRAAKPGDRTAAATTPSHGGCGCGSR